MKKYLIIMICFALLAALAVAALPFMAEEPVAESGDSEPVAIDAPEEEQVEMEYVRMIAAGNDPYGTFHFHLDGENTTIDPDETLWAAVRYRTVSQYDSTGVEFSGQFYVIPEKEPCVPLHYNFTGEWETAIVDLTQVSARTEFESIWDSANYINVDVIRFDPLEPDRDSEDTQQDEVSGKVRKGDCIDIAWIAFFETEYAARTYTGRENTPVAILDVDSFVNITNPNHLKVTKLSEMVVLPTVAPATEAPSAAPTKEPTAVPTDAPATDAPASEAPASGSGSSTPGQSDNKEESGKGANGVLIAALIAGGVIIAAIVVVLLLIKKKQKKA
jgi:hypothetical protein